MPRLRIPGSYDPQQSKADQEAFKTATLKIKEVRSYHITTARGVKAADEITPDPDDIIELELEEGFRFWVRADEIHTYFPQAQGRGTGDDTIEIAPTIVCETKSRGLIGKLVLNALRLIKLDPAEKAAGKIAKLLDGKFTSGGTGLFRLQHDSFKMSPCGNVHTDRPILLFIHGAFSSTEGSFGDLWQDQRAIEREALFNAYQDNVYGFEHPTLTESPFANARALAEALPAGARLHVVSHSRGGMVGELLCRGFMEDGTDPFTKDDRDILTGQKGQPVELDALGRLLKTKNIRVERFVRVACPTRGTTLASERIDRWLSVVVNLLGKVPALKASGVYDVLTEFILAVVKEHTDPRTFPGLSAMMPDSPCVALLNRPGVTVHGELRVISGDIEGTGMWGKLKLLLPDRFYGGEHDLVVNTASMCGGAQRQEGRERFFFHQGPNVSHFRYFTNMESTQKLVAAMTAGEGVDDGFETLVRRPSEAIPRSVRKGAPTGPRPICFVLPGIMGSHLAVGDDRVWLNPLSLATGGFEKLAINKLGVRAEAPLRLYYGDLIDFLAQTHEVRTFPFDWRRPIPEEARRLAEEIALALDQAERDGQPVRIIAHSMGGIVARAMLAERPDVWKRMCAHKATRFVMLGTPNGGAFATVRTLMAREPYIRYLAMIDLRHNARELLEFIASYGGLLSLLPQASDRNYLDPATWTALYKADDSSPDWVTPDQKALAAARETWELLQKSPVDPERMIYVAGKAEATPCGLMVEKDTKGKPTVQFMATPKGDGRVPWDTGILKGLKVWYMEVEHGDLSCHEPAFEALRELLEIGSTHRLVTDPPISRGVTERFTLREEGALLYPDYHDLEAAALGASRRVRKSKPQELLHVRVTHGNMSYTEAAVAVGHYQGDGILSAEAYLDRILEGRLSKRYRLGVYPGEYDISEVFLNPGRQPGGAIVIGLGEVGKLTPGRLETVIAHAALKYAMAIDEVRPSGAKILSPISSVLIGTGGNTLSVADAVSAIIGGVLKANDALRNNGYDDRIVFKKLELIEVYEDRAIQAMRALNHLSHDPSLQERIDPEPELLVLDSGRRRASYEEDPGWWRRVQITETDYGSLRYLILTDRARAEGLLQLTQRSLVDGLIQQATASTAGRDDSIGVTLFELLMPNEYKDTALEKRDTLFILDKAAARYPWELLRDRTSLDQEPLVVRAKFVRQLATERYRRQVTTTRAQTALVIGDPLSAFPPLAGARAEASKVARRLQEARIETECLIQKDFGSILDALFAREYRLLHLAAHGVYEFEAGTETDKDGCIKRRLITGMVLGDETFLTPAEINQMRVTPELVFINCCTLGKVGEAELLQAQSALAANLATQIIEMGVRAVVAAGWEVDDEVGLIFADCFYEQMLAGHTFSEALLTARKAAYDKNPLLNTWGAYQAYGDPDYKLRGSSDDLSNKQTHEPYVAPIQPILDLKNITVEAKNIDPPQREELRQHLDALATRIPKTWLSIADIRVSLGEAYGELKLFEEAISHYQSALGCPLGNMPIHAIEQLCNLQVSQASEEAGSAPQKAIERIEEAKRRIETLITLSPSSERYSILGSACKCMALLHSGKARLADLDEMTNAYEKAAQHTFSVNRQIDTYATKNWVTGEVLLRLIDPGKRRGTLATLHAKLKKTQEAARQQQLDKPGFWNQIIPIDCELLRQIVAMDLAENVDAIADTYREIAKQAGSPYELGSVVDQFAFLIEMLGERKADKQVAVLILGLSTLRKALVQEPVRARRTRKK